MKRRVPLWLKIAYTGWVIVWMILYSEYVHWQHYLWMCHLGHVIIVVGLWTESGLLLSWQALALLIPDLIWTVDFWIGVATGGHTPFGAAWNVFQPNEVFPRLQRALSLFHLVMPWLLIWALWRFGYDRRAFWLQAATCWVLFPITFFVSRPGDNINWVYGPFGKEQHVVAPLAFMPAAMVLYVVVLYLPSHLLLCLLAPRHRHYS